jgi:hypothetical protein
VRFLSHPAVRASNRLRRTQAVYIFGTAPIVLFGIPTFLLLCTGNLGLIIVLLSDVSGLAAEKPPRRTVQHPKSWALGRTMRGQWLARRANDDSTTHSNRRKALR